MRSPSPGRLTSFGRMLSDAVRRARSSVRERPGAESMTFASCPPMSGEPTQPSGRRGPTRVRRLDSRIGQGHLDLQPAGLEAAVVREVQPASLPPEEAGRGGGVRATTASSQFPQGAKGSGGPGAREAGVGARRNDGLTSCSVTEFCNSRVRSRTTFEVCLTRFSASLTGARAVPP